MREIKIYLSFRQKVSYTFILSIIAIVLSIVAVIRCEPMELDAVVLLASIISVPVAVFAITQAINFLWYENKIKSSLDELSRELRADFRRAEHDMQVAIRSYHLMISKRSHIVSDFGGHIQGALDALLEDSKSHDHLAAQDIIEQLYTYMKGASRFDRYIDTSLKTEYIKALSQINDCRISEICDFIFSCSDIMNLEDDKKKFAEELELKKNE